jgi:4-hydroxy-tetrahydrodipicolinate synthase
MNWLPGAYTALVTPFKEDQSLDLESFQKLLKHQVKGNVSGIVLWGSTGEGPLLSSREKFVLLEVTQDVLRDIKNPPQIILNVGGSSTGDMATFCAQLTPDHYDGMMVVVPPYVKPPVEGIIEHVKTLKSFNKPILFYHIPARTGRRLSIIEIETLLKACPQISALKEASGDLEILTALTQKNSTYSSPITLYCGDDPLYLSALKNKVATGVVSVLSNTSPAPWQTLTLEKNSDFETLNAAFKVISSVPNPIGIKHALFKLGIISSNMCRLPLVPYPLCNSSHNDVSPNTFESSIEILRPYL